MRSWSEALALGAVTLALGAAAPANPPPAVTLWGYEFAPLFTHEGISSYTHRAGDVRLDVTMIRGVPAGVAADYVADEVRLFESLFTLKRTGYPGQTTRYIECPPELRPVYAEADARGEVFRYFRTFANANHVAGVSSPDLAAYRLLKGYLACAALECVFEIELFSPTEGPDPVPAFLSSLGCPGALP